MTWTQSAVDAFLSLAPFTRFVLWLLFFLILPLICERLRVPGVLGFLVMGFLLGPTGFNLLQPELPIAQLAAELGVALLLFFVGYDIDFALLKRARTQVIVFGVLTFSLPMAMGYYVARSCGYGVNAALLIGSLIASHTLLAYPILNRLGIVQRVSVMVASGATVFTDVAAMLVLAICLITHERGFSVGAIELQLLQIAVFIPAIVIGGPWVLRRILARMKRDESRIIVFFLAVAVASQAAELFGLDGIVGAFLAGIAVRQAAPESRNAGVMKLISDTFLIPAFFLTTGMLLHPIDALLTFVQQPVLAFGLLFALLGGKGLAAMALAPLFRYTRSEVGLVWSLTLPQVAATLAAATVAHRTLNPAGEPLVDGPVLNVILMLVVLTSLGAPLFTQRVGIGLQAEARDDLAAPLEAPARQDP